MHGDFVFYKFNNFAFISRLCNYIFVSLLHLPFFCPVYRSFFCVHSSLVVIVSNSVHFAASCHNFSPCVHAQLMPSALRLCCRCCCCLFLNFWKQPEIFSIVCDLNMQPLSRFSFSTCSTDLAPLLSGRRTFFSLLQSALWMNFWTIKYVHHGEYLEQLLLSFQLSARIAFIFVWFHFYLKLVNASKIVVTKLHAEWWMLNIIWPIYINSWLLKWKVFWYPSHILDFFSFLKNSFETESA